MNLDEKLAIEKRLADLTLKGGGRLTAEAVVKDAESKKSPLHARIFRDSDSEAAHQYRLDLARELIRSVRVNVTVDRRAISVVGYVHDPGDSKSGYVPTISLVNERERAKEAIMREFARIESIIARSREIADVLDLRGQLESMLEGVQRFVEEARRVA